MRVKVVLPTTQKNTKGFEENFSHEERETLKAPPKEPGKEKKKGGEEEKGR